MHTAGLTDLEHLTRQRMDDVARNADDRPQLPPPRRRSMRRHAATRLRTLADAIEP